VSTQDGAWTARPWTARAGLLALAAACLLPAAGCGGSAGELQPVHGRVYYRGSPLAGGTIVFTPDPERGGAGPLAYGEIESDGHYRLYTERNRPGAVAGWHRVTVVSLEAPPAGISEAEAPVRSVLPARYRDPELSGLAREVKAGADNTLDFNLD
jgi:hypothetical protein